MQKIKRGLLLCQTMSCQPLLTTWGGKLWLASRFFLLFFILLLSACGFHLQNTLSFAPPLHIVYLQTNDPYGTLARTLHELFKTSDITMVDDPSHASTILTIIQNNQSETLLSVNATQQTRQYNLHTVVVFSVNDAKGHELVPPQIVIENRPITIQASQILAGSNEIDLFYKQMQRSLASDILDRLASQEVSELLMSKPSS